jgi:hypothetical protein
VQELRAGVCVPSWQSGHGPGKQAIVIRRRAVQDRCKPGGKDGDQLVFQACDDLNGTGIPLTPAPADQLAIDARGLMELGQDDISPDTFTLLDQERNALIIAAAQRAGSTAHRCRDDKERPSRKCNL